jgi:hypothetical protein
MRAAAAFLLTVALLTGISGQLLAVELPHVLVTLHGDCRCRMPSTPERQSQYVSNEQTGLEMSYEAYMAEDPKSSIFMLLIASYTSGIDAITPEANLEGFLNGMLGYHPDNQLEEARYEPLAGRHAMAFLLRNRDRLFRGHVLLEGRKLYLLAMESESDRQLESDYVAFSESFELLEASPS